MRPRRQCLPPSNLSRGLCVSAQLPEGLETFAAAAPASSCHELMSANRNNRKKPDGASLDCRHHPYHSSRVRVCLGIRERCTSKPKLRNVTLETQLAKRQITFVSFVPLWKLRQWPGL